MAVKELKALWVSQETQETVFKVKEQTMIPATKIIDTLIKKLGSKKIKELVTSKG